MKFKIDASIDTWIRGVEIDAKSKEEALEKFYNLSISDMLDYYDGVIEETATKDEEVTCIEKTLVVKVEGIHYDVTEDDVEGTGESVEDVLARLPQTVTVEVNLYADYDDLDYPDDNIADAVTDETGWLIRGFDKYTILEEK